MPDPIDLTQAQLIGGESTVNRVFARYGLETQEFAFSGLSSIFSMSLGGRGALLTMTGLLRSTAQADPKDAAQELIGLIEYIRSLSHSGQVFNLFASETTRTAYLYMGTATSWTSLIVTGFAETSERAFSKDGSNHRAVVAYEIQLLRAA